LASETLDRDTILSNWDQYVQSPAELAHSRARRFPYRTRESLASVLDVGPDHEVLEVGSGTGILGAHLGQVLSDPSQMHLVEPNDTFRGADVPESLKTDPGVRVHDADGRRMPFEEDRFDRVLSHTLFNILDESTRAEMLDEMKRVVRPGGKIIAMDAVAGAHWRPDAAGLEEDEQKERKDRFYELHQSVHTDVDTGLYRSFNRLPGWFQQQGLQSVETRGWFQPCRLSDDHWSEDQTNALINLEYQANLDRIENLRRLMKETGHWEAEYGELFRDLAMDFQRLSHRRRKVFDSAGESGWTGGASLVVIGESGTTDS
jgi:SAM-dependent methyltransferase